MGVRSYYGKTRKPWFNEGIMNGFFQLLLNNFPRLLEGALGSLQLVAFIHVLVGVCITYRAGKDFRLLPLIRSDSVCVYLFFRGTPSACADIFLVYYGASQFDAVERVYFGPI